MMNPLTEHEKAKRRAAATRAVAEATIPIPHVGPELAAAAVSSVYADAAARLPADGYDPNPEFLGAQMKNPVTRAINFIASQPWAITREALDLIDSIAHRANESPEAVATKLGRPLQGTRTVDMRNGVAVLPVAGPIFRYANIFTEISGASSIDTMAMDLRAALDDDAVDAIVLDIDSPGGMVAGVSEFADMVRAADKPVTAYVGALAASAAYWIAAAADEIVLDKSAEVGSVGAVMQMQVNADKSTREIVSSQSPNKRPNVDTDDGRTELQGRIDALAQVFIESVADFRGVDAETVINGFGRGGMKLGEAAVSAGMADRLGSLESTIAGMSGGTERSILMNATVKTSDITRDYIAAEHPAIASAFSEEAIRNVAKNIEADKSDHMAKGAEAERARIFAVLDMGKGTDHEALAYALAADGVTTGPEAAVKILAADKEAKGKALDNLRKDAPEKVVALVEDDGQKGIDPNLPVEERAKAAWASDPKVRAEFTTEAEYVAYTKAVEAGRVKVMGKAS